MKMQSVFCASVKIASLSLLASGLVVNMAKAMPLSWDLQVNSPAWVEQIQVTNSEGSTVTVTGYTTSGSDFTIERARVTGFGPQAGIGVCGTNEIRLTSICEGSLFINRNSVLDKSLFDLVLIEFDQTMSGRLSLLIGGPGSIQKSNNYWFGRGPSSDLVGLTFDDLNQQYDHIVTGINAVNGFGFNHPFPESGEDYDWVLLSPGGLGQRFLLSSINGTAAAPVDPSDPVNVSSPATYSLFALGAVLLLLGTHRRRTTACRRSQVESLQQG